MQQGSEIKLMKPEDVFIGWNSDEALRLTEILVTDDAAEWTEVNHRYARCGGKCYSGWLRPSVDDNYNYDPIGAFGALLARGFATKRAFLETLEAFSMIDSCDWARRMLSAAVTRLKDEDLDQPY